MHSAWLFCNFGKYSGDNYKVIFNKFYIRKALYEKDLDPDQGK